VNLAFYLIALEVFRSQTPSNLSLAIRLAVFMIQFVMAGYLSENSFTVVEAGDLLLLFDTDSEPVGSVAKDGYMGRGFLYALMRALSLYGSGISTYHVDPNCPVSQSDCGYFDERASKEGDPLVRIDVINKCRTCFLPYCRDGLQGVNPE